MGDRFEDRGEAIVLSDGEIVLLEGEGVEKRNGIDPSRSQTREWIVVCVEGESHRFDVFASSGSGESAGPPSPAERLLEKYRRRDPVKEADRTETRRREARRDERNAAAAGEKRKRLRRGY